MRKILFDRGQAMGKKKEPCREILGKMYLMLEGGQSGSLCERLRIHLAGCESCKEQYGVLEDLVRLCQRFPNDEVPEEQKRRMKEKLLKAISGQGTAEMP